MYFKKSNKNLDKKTFTKANQQFNSIIFLRSPKHFNKGKHKVLYFNFTGKIIATYSCKQLSTYLILKNDLQFFFKQLNNLHQQNHSKMPYHLKLSILCQISLNC